MKKGDWLFVVFDVFLVLWLILYPGESMKSFVFLLGLLVNDVFAIHEIKYGHGKFSRIVGDLFRYIYVTMFSVSFLFMFFIILWKAQSYLNAPTTWVTLWGMISVLIFMYYFPAFLAVGRYEMYRSYGSKNFWDAAEYGIKKSIRAAFSLENVVYLAVFYGGLFVVTKVGELFSDSVSGSLVIGYFFFSYAVLPVMAEKLHFKPLRKKKKK